MARPTPTLDILKILDTATPHSREWNRAARIITRRIDRWPDTTEQERRLNVICRAIADRGHMTNDERAEIEDYLYGPRF